MPPHPTPIAIPWNIVLYVVLACIGALSVGWMFGQIAGAAPAIQQMLETLGRIVAMIIFMVMFMYMMSYMSMAIGMMAPTETSYPGAYPYY